MKQPKEVATVSEIIVGNSTARLASDGAQKDPLIADPPPGRSHAVAEVRVERFITHRGPSVFVRIPYSPLTIQDLRLSAGVNPHPIYTFQNREPVPLTRQRPKGGEKRK
jgi:hypothetical protein